MLKTLPNPYREREYEMRLRAPLRCRCPVNQRTDDAEVTMRYVPGLVLVEYGSFRAYLDSFASTAATHEEVTNRILEQVLAVLVPKRVTVTTVWRAIEGVEVTVEAAG